MVSSAAEWISAEFDDVSFYDKRLNQRFRTILEGSLAHSQSTLAGCFDSWGAIKGAYRFLSNEKVECEAILAPHIAKTIERAKHENIVLLIQDTVYLDFKHRDKTTGLDFVWKRGEGSSKPTRGLILHNLLAVSTKGVPLGILGQNFIERKTIHGPTHRISRYWNNPIQDKESHRWIQSIRSMHAQDFHGATTVHIADREGDIYELYRDCHDMREFFLIRGSVNRSINKTKRREPPSDKLFDHLRDQRAQGRVTIQLQCNGKTKFRDAQLSIIFSRITIHPPPNKTKTKDGDNLIMVPMYAIMAVERNPPKGVEPLEWVLLTNLDIDTVEAAIEKVRWYSLRWNVEVFHKILKSGCNAEKVQLRDAERLKKMIVIKSIVAWRLFWITREFERNAKQSCEKVLSKNEWKVLFRKFEKGKPLPNQPPTIGVVHRWIGRLGGFIGRKSDGSPGIISMWRGWTRFMDLIDDYESFCG